MNFIEFEYQFQPGTNGLLTAYVDGEPIASYYERFDLQEVNSSGRLFYTPSADVADHWLSFRLDSLGEIATAVTIPEIRVGSLSEAITITSADMATTVPEGTSLDVVGQFVGNAAGTPHSASVDWGDGAASSALIIELDGQGTAEDSHVYGDDGQHLVSLTVTSSQGQHDKYTTIAVVSNRAPSAGLIVPDGVVIGKPIELALMAADPSPVDQAAGFTYDIDWDGDGTVDETVSGFSPYTIEHTFDELGLTTVTVTATDKDGGVSDPATHTINVIQPVDIDVKPGSGRNPINLNSKGVIPISILTTDDFDASWVDVATVEFAGASPAHFAYEDVDGDGDMDLILHFRLQDTDLLETYADLLREDLGDGKLDDNHKVVDAVLSGRASKDGEDFFDFLGSDSVDLFLNGRKLKDLLSTL
jgi:hypothetical protein